MRTVAFSPPLVLALVLAATGAATALHAAAARRSGAGPAPVPRRLVPDLNASPERHLVLLPGIGPVRARSIVEERQRAGPFVDAQDLARVPGIGPATAAALADRVRVSRDPGPRAPERRHIPAVAAGP